MSTVRSTTENGVEILVNRTKPSTMSASHTRNGRTIAAVLSIIFLVGMTTLFTKRHAVAQEAIDPAAWGDDHVGKPIPMYMTGDECLFCHRDIGPYWPQNRHNTEMQIAQSLPEELAAFLKSPDAKSFGPETEYVLGGEETLRFLKPNGKYGQFAMHAAMVDPHGLNMVSGMDGGWDDGVFAARCAGCHTTAVETEIKAFAQASLDCFVCHGEVPAGHQNDPTQAILAKHREKEPLVEISLCGQCHLRGGVSESSGLPYPNQFVPGDNLFKDFQVDFSDAAIGAMNPGDAHIFANVRDVALRGDFGLTCVSCHDIHGQSSRKHRVLPKNERLAYCAICHDTPGDFKSFKTYERHSAVCEY